jgi:DNA modification methylase
VGRAATTKEILIAKVIVSDARRPLRDITDLANSIAEVGLLQPIVVTPDRKLVAGLHRLEACRALGWPTIPARVLRLDQLHAELAELNENFVRHELTVLEQAETLKRKKDIYEALYPDARPVRVRGGPGRGKRKTAGSSPVVLPFAEHAAKKLGVSSSKVRRTIQIAQNLDPKAADALRGTAMAESITDLVRLSRMDRPLQRDIAMEIGRGAVTIKTALQRLRWRRVRSTGKAPKSGSHFRLLHGDFAKVAAKLDPKSVDLVVADPPWSRAWACRLPELISVASRVLRPGGHLLVLIGQEFLPHLLAAARDQLDYVWTLCLRQPKPKQNWNAGVMSAWLPIVVLRRPGGKRRLDFRWDVLDDDPPMTKKDPWAKSERVLRELVDWYSEPGDTVLDLFVGSGSSGVAAISLGRAFMGVDDDKHALDIAANAIKAAKWASVEPAKKGRLAYAV